MDSATVSGGVSGLQGGGHHCLGVRNWGRGSIGNWGRGRIGDGSGSSIRQRIAVVSTSVGIAQGSRVGQRRHNSGSDELSLIGKASDRTSDQRCRSVGVGQGGVRITRLSTSSKGNDDYGNDELWTMEKSL